MPPLSPLPKSLPSLLFSLLLLSLLPPSLPQPSPSCYSTLSSIYSNPLSNLPLLTFSGKGWNDLGDPTACSALNSSHYILMRFTIPGSMMRGFLGICGPSDCQLSDYQTLDPLLTPFILTSLNISNTSALTVDFLDPDTEYQKDSWDLATYIIVFFSFTILLLNIVGTWKDLKKRGFGSTGSNATSNIEILELNPGSTHISGFGKIGEESSDNMKQNLLSKNNGSIMHSFAKEDPPSFLECFSFYTNLNRLYTYPANIRKLDFLNGLRVIILSWVVLCHVYFYRVQTPTTNPQEWFVLIKGAWADVLIAGQFSVDIFLFLAAFLATQAILTILQKKGKMNVLAAYIHRLYRIWPLYAFVLFFAWKVIPLLESGPVGFMFKEVWDYQCTGNWWSNLMFVNNFFPTEYPGLCMGWTWYLANDFQFFLLLPFIVMVYHKNKRLGTYTVTAGLIICIIINFALCFSYEFLASLDEEQYEDYWNTIYVKPYTRIGPYLMGIYIGFIFVECENQKESIPDPDNLALRLRNFYSRAIRRYALYFVAFWAMLIPTFLNYSINNYPETWSNFENALYLTFAKYSFMVGISIMILACLFGRAGFLCYFLNARVWTSVARVAYGFYLLHPCWMMWYYWGASQGFYLEQRRCLFEFFGFWIVTYLSAVVVTVMVESPLTLMEKRWVKRDSSTE